MFQKDSTQCFQKGLTGTIIDTGLEVWMASFGMVSLYLNILVQEHYRQVQYVIKFGVKLSILMTDTK